MTNTNPAKYVKLFLRNRRMIPKPGDSDREVPVAETFNEQTDDELSDKKLINDFKRNKHFPEKIASNLKFLSNLQPEWRRHVNMAHQIKDLHEADYPQLYDFLKFNQVENVGNLNRYNAVHNVRNQVVQNVVQNPGVQNVGNRNGLIVVLRIANQNAKHNRNGNFVAARDEGNGNVNNGNQVRCYNCRGIGHLARNCIVRPRRRDVAYLQTQLLIAQKEEARIQL
ncbi:integrase, catalytic region, zinc finger, CCHC-type containing protein [Tanacetum coccineum]